jgi:hypothetical protein
VLAVRISFVMVSPPLAAIVSSWIGRTLTTLNGTDDL